MNEFLSDELASESKDEKKLRAAENRALAKSQTVSRFRKPNQTSTISKSENQPFPVQFFIIDIFIGRKLFGSDDTTTNGNFRKLPSPKTSVLDLNRDLGEETGQMEIKAPLEGQTITFDQNKYEF